MVVRLQKALLEPISVTVKIRNIAVGGAGVGEVVAQSDHSADLLGISAFVPYTAPGEVVEAQVIERKDRFVKATLVNIIEASDERVEPKCPYFGSCGGCELQHMSGGAQRQAKFEMIRGGLRSAKLSQSVLERIAPVLTADEYFYRRRVSLHVDQTGRIGFYRASSRSVIPIATCPISVPLINDALANIQEFGRAIQGKLSSVLLEADDDGLIAVLKSPYDLGLAERRAVMSTARKYFQNALLLVNDKEIDGFGRKVLEIPLSTGNALFLRVPAGGFFQVNSRINIALIQRVLELVRSQSATPSVYDLYSGAGNFSIPLARHGASVTAVESDPALVALGKQTAQRYSLEKNVEFIEASVERFLGNRKSPKKPDIIIADPPRSGLGNLAQHPVLTSARQLVLISCHLPSFFRDAKALTDHGWEVSVVQPFDMFSQTSYAEVLTSFVR